MWQTGRDKSGGWRSASKRVAHGWMIDTVGRNEQYHEQHGGIGRSTQALRVKVE